MKEAFLLQQRLVIFFTFWANEITIFLFESQSPGHKRCRNIDAGMISVQEAQKEDQDTRIIID